MPFHSGTVRFAKWAPSFSFRYFGEDDGGNGYYSVVRFREISVHIRLLALWRYLGFEFLVNRPRWFLVPGKVIEWHLAAINDEAVGSPSPANFSGVSLTQPASHENEESSMPMPR